MTFDVDKTVNYWLTCAAYDVETAAAMLEKERYPYALFFGHLALEKLLKAFVVKITGNHAPVTHSLTLLSSKLPVILPEEYERLLRDYKRFNLETRYPDVDMTVYRECTPDFTRDTLGKMREIYTWLRAKL